MFSHFPDRVVLIESTLIGNRALESFGGDTYLKVKFGRILEVIAFITRTHGRHLTMIVYRKYDIKRILFCGDSFGIRGDYICQIYRLVVESIRDCTFQLFKKVGER